MTYNPNIPINTDYMVNSQIQCKSNFQSINNVWSRNHIPLNNAQQGMHKVILIKPQTADPTTPADQVCLYTKTVGSDTNLYFMPNNTQTPIQLTYPSISTGLSSTDPNIYLDDQYTYMAGPFVIYVGNLFVADGFVKTLTPSTTLIYVGLVIVDSGQGAAKTAACGTNLNSGGTNFTVRYSGGFSALFKPRIRYLAIGI